MENEYVDQAINSAQAAFPNWENTLAKVRELESMGIPIMIDTTVDNSPTEYMQDSIDRLKEKWNQLQLRSQDLRDRANRDATSVIGMNNIVLYQTILGMYDNKCEEIKSDTIDNSIENSDTEEILPYLSPEEAAIYNCGKGNKVLKELGIDSTTIMKYYIEEGSLKDQYTYCDALERLTLLSKFSKNKSGIYEAMADLGWNPEIPFSRAAATKTYLRHNIIPIGEVVDYTHEAINEGEAFYDNSKAPDLDTLKKNITPVFVCLLQGHRPISKAIMWFTDSDWSHAAFGLDSNLQPLYAFNAYAKGIMMDQGFSVEGLKEYMAGNPEAKIKVFALFIRPDQKKEIEETIQWYLDNKNTTRYNFMNLVSIALKKKGVWKHAEDKGKMICSQFVYTLLSLVNFKMTKTKTASKVTPADINTLSDDARFFAVYEGRAKDYKKGIVDRLCTKILPTLPMEEYGLDESTEMIPKSAIQKKKMSYPIIELAKFMYK